MCCSHLLPTAKGRTGWRQAKEQFNLSKWSQTTQYRVTWCLNLSEKRTTKKPWWSFMKTCNKHKCLMQICLLWLKNQWSKQNTCQVYRYWVNWLNELNCNSHTHQLIVNRTTWLLHWKNDGFYKVLIRIKYFLIT